MDKKVLLAPADKQLDSHNLEPEIVSKSMVQKDECSGESEKTVFRFRPESKVQKSRNPKIQSAQLRSAPKLVAEHSKKEQGVSRKRKFAEGTSSSGAIASSRIESYNNKEYAQVQGFLWRDSSSHLMNEASFYTGKEAPGYFSDAGTTYVLPSLSRNLMREFFHQCIESMIFHNTLLYARNFKELNLVIAGVLLNFHRWYPRQKVIYVGKELTEMSTENCDECLNQNIVTLINIMKRIVSNSETVGLLKEDINLRDTSLKIVFATSSTIRRTVTDGSYNMDDIRCIIFDGVQEIDIRNTLDMVVKSFKISDSLGIATSKCRLISILHELPVLSIAKDIERHVNYITTSNCTRVMLSEDGCSTRTEATSRIRNIEVVPINTMNRVISRLYEDLSKLLDRYLRKLREANVLQGNMADINQNKLKEAQRKFRVHHPELDEKSKNIIANFEAGQQILPLMDCLREDGVFPCIELLQGMELCDLLANTSDLQKLECDLDTTLDCLKDTVCHPKLNVLHEKLEAFTQQRVGLFRIIVFVQSPSLLPVVMKNISTVPKIKPAIYTDFENGKLKAEDINEVKRMFKNYDINTLVVTNVKKKLNYDTVDLLLFLKGNSEAVKLISEEYGYNWRDDSPDSEFAFLVIISEGMEMENFNALKRRSKKIPNVVKFVSLQNVQNAIKQNSSHRLIPHGIQLSPIYFMFDEVINGTSGIVPIFKRMSEAKKSTLGLQIGSYESENRSDAIAGISTSESTDGSSRQLPTKANGNGTGDSLVTLFDQWLKSSSDADEQTCSFNNQLTQLLRNLVILSPEVVHTTPNRSIVGDFQSTNNVSLKTDNAFSESAPFATIFAHSIEESSKEKIYASHPLHLHDTKHSNLEDVHQAEQNSLKSLPTSSFNMLDSQDDYLFLNLDTPDYTDMRQTVSVQPNAKNVPQAEESCSKVSEKCSDCGPPSKRSCLDSLSEANSSKATKLENLGDYDLFDSQDDDLFLNIDTSEL